MQPIVPSEMLSIAGFFARRRLGRASGLDSDGYHLNTVKKGRKNENLLNIEEDDGVDKYRDLYSFF